MKPGNRKWGKSMLAILLSLSMAIPQSSLMVLAEDEGYVSEEPVAVQEVPAEVYVAPAQEEAPAPAAPEPAAPEPAVAEPAEPEPAVEAPAADTQDAIVEEALVEAEQQELVEEAVISEEAVTEELPETPAYGTVFTYEDSYFKVTANTSEAALIPENAVLHADWISPDSKVYKNAAAQIEDKLAAELTDRKEDAEFHYEILDVYFIVDGVEGRVIPADKMNVSVDYKKPLKLVNYDLANETDVHTIRTEVVCVAQDGKTEILRSDINPSEEKEIASFRYEQQEQGLAALVRTTFTEVPEAEEAIADDELFDVEIAAGTRFTYEDSDVKITAETEESAEIPADAILHADYMDPSDEAYLAAASELNSQLSDELSLGEEDTEIEYVLYDIYFTSETVEGRIEPNDKVKVTIEFKTPVETEGSATAEQAEDDAAETVETINLQVVHLPEDGAAEIVTENVYTNEDGAVTGLDFFQDTFSPTGLATVRRIIRQDNKDAYVSGLALHTTENNSNGVFTGTEPFDKAAGDGCDTTADDLLVRSYDSVTYNVETTIQSNGINVIHKKIAFELSLPNAKDIEFDWRASSADAEPTYKVVGDNKVYSYTITIPENDATGSGAIMTPVVLNVKGETKGSKFTPKVAAWLMDENDPSQQSDRKELILPEVEVTTTPAYNVIIKSGKISGKNDFDFTNSSYFASSQGYTGNHVIGYSATYGIAVEVAQELTGKGIRGVQLPKDTFSFDIKLSSEYKPTGENQEAIILDPAKYTPVLYYAAKNEPAAQNSLIGSNQTVGSIPYSDAGTGDNPHDPKKSCNNSGTYSITQTSADTIHVEISGFVIDPAKYPKTDIDGNTTYWTEIDKILEGVFSSYQFTVIWPFQNNTNAEKNNLQSEYSLNGGLTLRARIENASGKSVEDEVANGVKANTKSSDDTAPHTRSVTGGHGRNHEIFYSTKDNWTGGSDYDPETQTEYTKGDDSDSTVAGAKLAYSYNYSEQNVAPGDASDGKSVSIDGLVLFEDGAFEILEGQNKNAFRAYDGRGGDYTCETYYVSLADGGYLSFEDAKTITLDDTRLRFTKDKPADCVGILYRWRGCNTSTESDISLLVQTEIQAKQNVELLDRTYMLTAYTRAYQLDDFGGEDTVKAALRKDTLTPADIRDWAQGDAGKGAFAQINSEGKYVVPNGVTGGQGDGTNLYAAIDNRRDYIKPIYDAENGGYQGNSSFDFHKADTIYLIPYYSHITKTVANANSTFKVSDKERYADFKLTVDLEYAQSVKIDPENAANTTVFITDTLPKGLTYVKGSAVWGTTGYKTEKNTEPSEFAGGIQIEPETIEAVGDDTKLVWEINNVPAVSGIVGSLMFTCKIGDEKYPSNDVANNASLKNVATVRTSGEKRAIRFAYKNISEAGITIVNQEAYNINKRSKQDLELNDIGYFDLLVSNSYNDAQKNVFMVDSMPADGKNGTVMTGEYKVTSLTMDASEAALGLNGINDVEIWYSKNPEYAGLGLTEFDRFHIDDLKETNTDPSTGWVKAAKTISDDGKTASFTDEGLIGTWPSAIAYVDEELGGKRAASIRIEYEAKAVAGDLLINNFMGHTSSTDIASEANANPYSRSLSGVVWEDSDFDGIIDTDEKKLAGVTVQLLQYDSEKDKFVALDSYKDIEGKSVSASTTTNADGFYSFDRLKMGQYKVIFQSTDKVIDLGEYVLTKSDEGNDITKNSKVNDSDTTVDGKVIEARITGVEMPSLSDIKRGSVPEEGMLDERDPHHYILPNQNCGLYKVTREINGYAWFDKNADGRNDSDKTGTEKETVLSGLIVSLKIQDSATGEYIPYVVDKTPVFTTTDENGYYEFTDLPEGDFEVVFTSGSATSIDELEVTAKFANNEDARNSKADREEVDGKTTAVISNIILKSDADLITEKTSKQIIPNQNAGFIKVKSPEKDVTINSDTTSGDGQLVKTGDTLTYTVKAYNSTGKDAQIIIKDPIPEGTEYVKNSAKTEGRDISGIYDEIKKELTWTIGEKNTDVDGTSKIKNGVAAGKSVTVVFQVKVTSGEKAAENAAEVYVKNNPDTTVTPVETNKVENPKTEKDVSINKATGTGDDGKTTKKGDHLTYSVTVYNTESKEAKIVIKDAAPEGTKFFGIVDTDDTKAATVVAPTNANGDITWTFSKVAAGKSVTVKFEVEVTADTRTSTINNKASVQLNDDPSNILETNTVENPLYHRSISGTAWYDAGKNGVFEEGDQLLPDVKVYLYEDGKTEPTAVTTTDNLGKYSFSEETGVFLTGGTTYRIVFEGPDKYTISTPDKAVTDTDRFGNITKANTAIADRSAVIYSIQMPTDDAMKKAGVSVYDLPEQNIAYQDAKAPEKKETSKPGENNGTKVGDEITYQISYQNHTAKTADITVTDTLSAGLEYKSAKVVEQAGKTTPVNEITVSKDKKTVIWELKDVPADYIGQVELTAVVTKEALTLDKVTNSAAVTINHDPTTAEKTNEIQNPLYHRTISGKAWFDEKQDGIYQTEDGDSLLKDIKVVLIKVTDGKETEIFTKDTLADGSYSFSEDDEIDLQGGTYKIVFTDKEGRAVAPDGKVTKKDAFGNLTDPDKALADLTGTISDIQIPTDAEMKSNGWKTYTLPEQNIAYMAAAEPKKAETTPGEGKPVQPGDTIDYVITYRNNTTATADVTVTDQLDKSLDVVADTVKIGKLSGGTTPEGTTNVSGQLITWTLAQIPAGAEGTVTFTAKVNAQAKAAAEIPNTAIVIVNDQKTVTNTVKNPVYHRSIEGYVWEDENKDGIRDEKETSITGEGKVTLYQITDGQPKEIGTADLDENGHYSFTDLPAGEFYVVIHEDSYVTIHKDVSKAPEGYNSKAVNEPAEREKADSVLTGIIRGITLPTDEELASDDYQSKLDANNNYHSPNWDAGFIQAEPHKTETTPGAGSAAQVGDKLTYQISYYNTHAEAAKVVITDKLDANVKYFNASAGSSYDAATHTVIWTISAAPAYTAGEVTLTVEVLESAVKPGKVVNTAQVQVGNDAVQETETIENPTNGTVTRSLEGTAWLDEDKDGRREAGEELLNGKTVRLLNKDGSEVKDKDGKAITATTDENGHYRFTNLPAGDFQIEFDIDEYVTIKKAEGVEDGANSKADNIPKERAKSTDRLTAVITEITLPTDQQIKATGKLSYNLPNQDAGFIDGEVHKKEADPGAGEAVGVGQQITYEISWFNTHAADAQVTVTDKLDGNVKFIAASEGSNYDEETHTVTWTVKDAPALQEGHVTLTVEVLIGAVKPRQVANAAAVQIGNDKARDTETIINPVVPEYDRTINGTAWLDKDRDGIRQDEDERLKEVTVVLYKKDENGDYVTTGEKTTTDENGYYEFNGLEPGDYQVVFEREQVVTEKSDTPNGRNSIADGLTDTDGNPSGAVISDISLPTDEEIEKLITDGELDTTTYVKEYQDAGFIEEKTTPVTGITGTLTVTKKLADIDDLSLIAEDASFYVALFQDDERVTEVQTITFRNSSSSEVTFKGLTPGASYTVYETDKNGDILENGDYDGASFAPVYEEDTQTITFPADRSSALETEFTNVFFEIPDGFYYEGQLTITKLVQKGNQKYGVRETFYAGIFTDTDHRGLLQTVELDMNGNSEKSVTVSVPLGIDANETITYYVAETDKQGNVLKNGTGLAFTISQDKTQVTVSVNEVEEVRITNTYPDVTTTVTPTITPTITPTAAPASAGGSNTGTAAGVRTGDDTPIALYLSLLLLAAALGVISLMVYRKKRSK